MSQPPHGPTPPYYGYPPIHHYTPAPGGYTYFPVPVPAPMMPMYAPPTPLQRPPEPVVQPTIVTNYIYHEPPPQPQQQPQPQPPPEPVRIPDPYSWVPSSGNAASSLSHRALVAGKEGWDGSPLWVIRAHHSCELIPGKLAIKHQQGYIPHAGKEIPVHNFEVLCCPPHAVRWVPASKGHVPPGAIPGGNTHTGETLYICRAPYKKSITPGKVHPNHKCAYISFGGQEVSFKNYEVLCLN